MDIQLYCPDCGEKLNPYYFRSLVPEVASYIHLDCTGRCLEDLCKASCLAPEDINAGITRYTYDAATINRVIAQRSDEGRSLPWLEAEHKTCQTTMLDTIRDISKYLHETNNREYGETPVQIENTLTNITILNAAASSDKSYMTGFLDALALMK